MLARIDMLTVRGRRQGRAADAGLVVGALAVAVALTFCGVAERGSGTQETSSGLQSGT